LETKTNVNMGPWKEEEFEKSHKKIRGREKLGLRMTGGGPQSVVFVEGGCPLSLRGTIPEGKRIGEGREGKLRLTLQRTP